MKAEEALKRLEQIFPGQVVSIPPEFDNIVDGVPVDESNYETVRYGGQCRISMNGKNLAEVTKTIRRLFKESGSVNEFAISPDNGDRFVGQLGMNQGNTGITISLKTIGGDEQENDIALDRSEAILRLLETHKAEIQAAMTKEVVEKDRSSAFGRR